MENLQINMEQFKFVENTVSLDWPNWSFRFENFQHLTNIDITIPAQAIVALRHLFHAGGPKICIFIIRLKATSHVRPIQSNFGRTVLNSSKHVFKFRNYAQDHEQSFDDYVTMLK